MISSGKMIVICGADGSGKSTVIDALFESLKQSENPVRILRKSHRGDTKAASPHCAKPPHPVLISLIKLLMRAIQWTIHYFLIYKPFTKKGGLLLSDRFFFDDVLIDPLKYRCQGISRPAKILRSIIPIPDIFILLDAPVEVLLSRKNDSTSDKIKELREGYLAFANKYHYTEISSNLPLAATLEDIRRMIFYE